MRAATTLLATATALSATTLAFPTPKWDLSVLFPSLTCVQESDAKAMADVFQGLIQNYTADLATSALTTDFDDYSSSVNIIINQGGTAPQNLTAPTFSGRQAFMDGQGSQPKIPFTQLNLFYGCDSVSLRWETTASAAGQKGAISPQEPVIGNVIMQVVPAEAGAKYRFRVKTLYSEFNSAAWLVNMGTFKPGPVPAGPPGGGASSSGSGPASGSSGSSGSSSSGAGSSSSSGSASASGGHSKRAVQAGYRGGMI